MSEQPAEHWAPRCVLCAARGRTRELDHGHVCNACAVGLRADLAAIVEAAAIAAVLPDPYATRGTGGGARPKPGSRPPLDVAHIDPELVLVTPAGGCARPRCGHEKGTPGCYAVPLLVELEDWCRVVREDRGWVPYGVATEDGEVTLAGTCGWLAGQVEWMTTEPSFAVEDFAGWVHRGLAALRALDPATERGGWRVPCPSEAEAPQGGVCGLRLAIDPTNLHGDVHCPRCGTTWTPQRLLLLALDDERVQVWAHPETITEALGIASPTLRRWGAAGTVPRRGTLYDVGAAHRARRT